MTPGIRYSGHSFSLVVCLSNIYSVASLIDISSIPRPEYSNVPYLMCVHSRNLDMRSTVRILRQRLWVSPKPEYVHISDVDQTISDRTLHSPN